MIFSNERGSIIDAELDFNAQVRKQYKLEKSVITLKRLIDYPPYISGWDYEVAPQGAVLRDTYKFAGNDR